MSDNPIADLMKAVDELTKDHSVTVDQRGVFLGLRSEHGLLLKLRVAVASSMGGEGAGKAGRERVPLNVGARDLYDRLAADITDLYAKETDQQIGRPTPEVTLRQWFIRYVNRYRQKQISDIGFDARIATLESWITQIRDLLDPPFRFPLTSPCPICGKEWVSVYKVDDPAEIERVRVLNAVERENIDASYVICRNPECGRIWKGAMQARTLRILIDDAAERKLVGAP